MMSCRAKFFQLLKKIFKKKVIYPSVNKLELLIIDDDHVTIHGALGISEERADVITNYIDKSLKRNEGKIMPSLKEVIDQCLHTNEVCFASQCFAVVMIEHRFEQDGNDILFT